MDCNFVQALEALRLRNAVLDHHRIEILHVRDADELIDVRIVPLIALQVGMPHLPLLMRLAKEGDVEYIRLIRVDDVHLRPRDRRRNEMLLNGIRVNAIVDLRQFPLRGPTELGLFLGLQSLGA